jgi:hypothetical protein
MRAATAGSPGAVTSGTITSGTIAVGSTGQFSGAFVNQVVDKVDLLFDIDNSASMGDKQQYLAQAIPDLIDRLVNPNCIDAATLVVGQSQAGQGCPAGSRAEFPSVKDMHIGMSGQHPAQWVGVDSTIIQERHDFLRPDSLVAVVVLSDENDSEIDVRSLGGLGYFFMRTGFAPPHGTSACATNPLSPDCVSCVPGNTDPACVAPGGGVAVYSAPNDWGYDPNLRHVHMRQKYGIDPQYPVERYFYGLTSPVIPDRNGEYPAGVTSYSGFGKNMECTNPLYAASLPAQKDLSATVATATPVSAADAKTLCNLTPGARTADKVFFVHIGGVPHQLLHFFPGDPAASTLSSADWVKILGTDPESYDFNGIDPHMYESYTPRLPGQAETLANPPTFDPSGTNALAVTGGPSDTDPVNGREWITDLPMGGHRLAVDRQFACIFPLTTPRDCTQAVNAYACDCPSTPLTHDQTPPVCSDTMPTMQIAAKAYPTIRELLVAKMMGVQGVVSSICPVDVLDNAAGDDPLYGYRPAVSALVDRLKGALTSACLPEKLTVTSNGSVSCSVLVTLPGAGSCTNPTCPANMGLTVPATSVLDGFCANAEASYQGEKGAPGDPALQSVCQLTQLVRGLAPAPDFDANGSCAASVDKGWCYGGAAADGCAQIVFALDSPPSGSLTSLECSPSP